MKKPAKKETKASLFTKKLQKRIEPANKYVSKLDRKSRLYTAILVLATLLLVLTSVWAGHKASDAYSTNSNALMLTQLFSKNTQYPAILPGPHATLIIIPLVYVQGHLPYHYTSFTLVNIGLVVLTMLAWAYLLIKLFGRKYEVPILVLLSSLIFTSLAFSQSLAYTTIRNIEYPIVLAFVMIVAYLLKGTAFSRKQLALATLGTVLFIITLAGDSFFNYAILLPLAVVIGLYWVQSRRFTINMVKALGLTIGTFVGATLLKVALEAGGIIHFDYGFWGPQTILPVTRIWQSVGVALTETLQMHGAYILGQVINFKNVAVFINFGLMIVGISGLLMILARANRSYRKQDELSSDYSFVLVVMAVSFFVIFLMYAVSGYAIATLPSGQIVSAKNARYISFLPLITAIGLVWILKNYYAKHTLFTVLICLALLTGIVTSYPSIRTAYLSHTQDLELAPPRESVDQIVDILKQNKVTKVTTDYWYGPVVRFWSNESILVTPQVGCDASTLANPNNRKFTQQQNQNVALIIDRGNLNYGFWQCSDEQLIELYGAPTKNFEVVGAGANPPVKIWVYNNTPQ